MEEQNHQRQAETNGKAIASMVLGILSLVIPYIGFVLGIIGIVLAKKSFNEIEQNEQGGRGMAIAGLTTSIIGTALYALLIIILIIGISAFVSY
ncbi:DUF4190 domain-containing protein [Aquibacillus sp. 3ASR75-11]|uniref:DUF4190 domain-containing protein n=1 Tax=Terrihalobacillus insolitus TaxID=2950438 RepID=A0A9X4AM25_9BACI|nr:DUF4190 domain-containing protein [Terrihalobacillus insolitus]MDC3412236.1 DUF4190 domain-containing protein [Terrihalobacillus insolitus]MDC3423070.1 DUF4190 domain-containing protein [Terrihalobacillus insolitus]